MNNQPYKSILEKDESFFEKVLIQEPDAIVSLEDAFAREWAGTTPDEFEARSERIFCNSKT